MRFAAAQIQALEDGLHARLVADLGDRLRVHHADLVADLDDPSLRAAVTDGIARAQAHGLRARGDVGFFVGLLFAIGPRFDQHPSVRAILEDEDATPEARAARLGAELTDDEWQEAAEL